MTRRLDVCIVTADFVGPIRNGGIGTAYYNLAQALVGAGHRVTVLYTLGRFSEDRTITHWVRHYKRAGIRFVPMPQTPVDGHASLRMAHGAYEWLKNRRFDIVHFHEWRGVGFYAALGKQQGLCLKDAVICVGAHSPVMWHHEGMNELADAESLEIDFMERKSVELADVLWTPSLHMRDWLAGQGWVLPSQVLHLPCLQLGVSPWRRRVARPRPELVFFGRLETRKGLDLFCDALDRLVARGISPRRVTFLGKTSTVNGESSGDYLKRRGGNWRFPWKVISNRDRDGAMAYLRGRHRVAVLPSRLDNLPYTVHECLGTGIPFVASAIGGIPEMVRPDDRDRILFDLSAASLTDRLAEVHARGLAAAPLNTPSEQTLAAWLAWHNEVAPERARRADKTDAAPLVSVCLTTRNRPKLLDAALASIRRQSYSNYEVILVDDGSDAKDAKTYLKRLEPEFRERGWQIVRQPNRYVGAARNAAIRASRGDYLLFMDDDNLAVPGEIGTFVRAATRGGADILTCLLLPFQSSQPVPPPPERIWPFLGGALVPGLLRNVFGDANGFFSRSVFNRIGVFSEDFGVGAEDWEIYARATLEGLRVDVVPEPLVWYRQSSQGMLNTTSQHANRMRAVRPYLHVLPAHLRPLVHLSRPAVSQPVSTEIHRPVPAVRLDHVERAVVFGTGEGGRMALDLAKKCGWTVPWFVDNNPGVWNTQMHGVPIKSPESLKDDPTDLVIVASIAGKPSISKQLEAMGLESGEHFVHFLDAVRVGNTLLQLSLP